MQDTVYFDNAATTFPKPAEVYEAMDKFYRENGVNAGRSSYGLAQKAGNLIEDTRKELASLVNLRDHLRVIFQPSATIALNQVIFGLDWEHGDVVYFSPFEHNSVLRPLEVLKKNFGVRVYEIPVDRNTYEFELESLEDMFKKMPPKLTIVSHVSNVIGIISPVEQIGNLTHNYGGLMLVDGAQSVGLIPIDLSKSHIDFLVFAGHKTLYGPLGIAGIFVNTDYALKPYIMGGTGVASEELTMPDEYPGRLEAGSPNIYAMAGLHSSVRWLKEQQGLQEKERKLLEELLNVLSNYPEIKVIGSKNITNMVSIVSITCDFYTPQELAMILDQNFNVAVRAGLHCAPNSHKFLGTLPEGTVRISLSALNSIQQINYLQNVLENILG